MGSWLIAAVLVEALDGRVLVAEGFEKRIGKVRAVERLFRKVGDGLFNLNCVQRFAPSGVSGVFRRGSAASSPCSAT